MIKVGITGQAGFVGTHLYNELGLQSSKYERIPFDDNFFSHFELLCSFVKRCDVIIHLAAVNRHSDSKKLYEINIGLINLLLKAIDKEKVNPDIIFSSSTQEIFDNPYGKSKLDGRIMLEKWAHEHKTSFTGMIIPNVFGPFGKPNYNSFIATFCNNLTHNQEPQVINDIEVNLLYVSSLCKQILFDIDEKKNINCPTINTKVLQPDFVMKISEILLLNIFKEQYFDQGIIPILSNIDEINLFNTFRSYIDIDKYFPFKLKQKADERGTFVETIRLGIGGQVSFSVTNPENTRGNHYHTRKLERFTVIKGKARIQLRRIGTEKVYDFVLDGKNPSYVDIPIWFTHNITNIGDEELYTQFWISEWYDEKNSDTFFEQV